MTTKNLNEERVLKVMNNNSIDDAPLYRVVLAKGVEATAADGQCNDYSLDNEESTCWSDLESELESQFPDTFFALDDQEIVIDTASTEREVTEEELNSIRDFAAEWLSEHEWHDAALYWNYYNGHGWTSHLLHSDDWACNDNKEYELLSEDDEKAKNVLDAYNRAQDASKDYVDGYCTIHDEESGYDVRFTEFSFQGSLADIF